MRRSHEPDPDELAASGGDDVLSAEGCRIPSRNWRNFARRLDPIENHLVRTRSISQIVERTPDNRGKRNTGFRVDPCHPLYRIEQRVCNTDVYEVRWRVKRGAPDMLGNHGACNSPASILHHVFEECELADRQIDLFAGAL